VLVNQCPHHLDLLLWLGGPVQELYGYWDNFNHPYIEVDDTVAAVMRFQNGAIGSLILSNSQNPALSGVVRVHGSNGASIGAEVESGAPFISGVTQHVDPPFNDIWTVPSEEPQLADWQNEDRSIAWNVMTHYHERQIEEFLTALAEDREPLVNGEAGRAVVELFTAVYAAERNRRPIRFPVEARDFTGACYARSSH
jgi:predicted dehydrogenase